MISAVKGPAKWGALAVICALAGGGITYGLVAGRQALRPSPAPAPPSEPPAEAGGHKGIEIESNRARPLPRAAPTEYATRVRLDIRGSGFLWNMVRIVAGTLVDVGRGRLAAGDIPAIITSRDRRRAGPTLPPTGLCLEWVRYREVVP